MLIFTITTATKLASISLCKDYKVLGEINIEVSKTHSTTILDQIDKLFTWTGQKLENVTDVLVSIGPGSFTGVRIAISVVKGLFFGKSIKVYSVNELDALAYQGYFLLENLNNNKIYALIDSGKEKVYYACYDIVKVEKDKKIEKLLTKEYKVGKLDNVIEEIFLENKSKEENNNFTEFYLIGDAILNYKQKINEKLIGNDKLYNKIKLFNDDNIKITSKTFIQMYKRNLLQETDIYSLKPNYLEKSQAEREKYGI